MFFDNDKLVLRKDAPLSDVLIDPFEKINFDEKHFEVFTDDELIAAVGSGLMFDVECYPNYFLVAFKSIELKRVVYFECGPDTHVDSAKLSWILQNFWIVGFNSNSYDMLLVTLALCHYSSEDLKDVSNIIIFNGLHPKEFQEQYKVSLPRIRHVDLIEVAPLQASLKTYAGRLHCHRMQELPFPHDKILTEREKKGVLLYCINDLDDTILLFNELRPQLTLRHELSQAYGTDLLSKSDAQISEAVITAELKRLNGWFPKRPIIAPGTSYKYTVPPFLEYKTDQLQQMLEVIRAANFVVTPNGNCDMPAEVSDLKISLGQCVYKMGIGGLHSTEKCVSHHADDQHYLIDKDVASYYPAIILNLELFPKHLGRSFLQVYRDIVNRRLEAKRANNKVVADSLKITINGCFGKLGNVYSALYSPDLLIQVTITGQLCLLLLIEMLEQMGISVLSANTDGIIFKCPKDRYAIVESMIIYWQKLTGFDTEETRYRSIYSRDVNNYVAIKENGEHKSKGTYSEKGSAGNTVLSKNPETLICNDALIAFLRDGTPVDKTVMSCKDIRRFVAVRNVKGGAEKSGVYLGKAVRWYYSTKMKGDIVYRTSGNKVAKTDNAMPLMELPSELPSDIDYDYYIATAKELIKEIGYYEQQKSMKLF
jgi:hypothetical protein